MFPEISVVIPVRNEAAKITACIEGILSQTVPVKEIIVVDSGSTDGTLDILRRYPQVTVLSILPADFNHGETRNHGVRHAAGEFVILTVGDAQAYDDQWIQELLNGFDGADVAGVCGQQVVPHHRDKNPLDWYRPVGPRTKTKYHFPAGAFEKLSAYDKMRSCGWDDVTAMYRRSVLREIPFQRTSFGEDAIWAQAALQAGYAIVYNSAARVYHYHTEDKEFTFKRMLTTLYLRYRQFQFRYPKNNGKKNYRTELSRLKQILTAKPMTFSERLAWLKYNKQYAVAVKEAHDTFERALAIGEDELDKVHFKFCGKPPIPLKQPLQK